MLRTSVAISLQLLSSEGSFGLDQPIYMGGGMGEYFEGHLLSKEYLGIQDNWIAQTRYLSNSGTAFDAEYLVNCNEGFPQVVDQDERTVHIDLNMSPPTYLSYRYEVWYATCRREHNKFGESGTPNVNKDQLRSGFQLFNGDLITVTREVIPKKMQMQNLVKLNIKGTGYSANSSGTAFLYCSTSVPTLYLEKRDYMLQLSFLDNDNELDKALGRAIQKNFCVRI